MAASQWRSHNDQRDYTGLEGKPSVGFYNIGDAEEAKEKFLKAVYDLKHGINVQKEGVRNESFEI